MNATTGNLITPRRQNHQYSLSKSMTNPRAKTAGGSYNSKSTTITYSTPQTSYVHPIRAPLTLRPIIEQFDDLTFTVEHFIKTCFIDKTYDKLPIQYLRVQKNAELFFQKSGVFFSSQIPGHSINPSITLIKESKTFMSEWTDFISELNMVSSTGLTPNFLLLTNSVANLKNSIQLLFQLGQMGISRVGSGQKTYHHLLNTVEALHRYSQTIYRSGLIHSDSKFDPTELQTLTIQAIEETTSKVPLLTPRWTSNSAEIMRLRTEITIQCENIKGISNGILGFNNEVKQTRDCLIKTSEAFSDIFKRLGLPFDIKLDIIEEEDQSDSKENEPKDNKSEANARISSINHKMSTIEKELNTILKSEKK